MTIKKTLLVLSSISFILVTLLTTVDLCCFDYDFYEKEYKEIGVAETIGCSFEDLMDATRIILDYTQDKRDDMIATETIKGEVREFYNDREKAHMIDVKDLYLTAMKVRNISLIIIVISTIYFIYKKENVLFSLSQIYNKVSLVFLVFLTFIGIYAASDFNSFWINFHHVFFTKNDYWLLNPKTDLLINMVPEQFFFDLVFKILIIFVLIFTLSNVACLIKSKKEIEWHD